MIVGVTIRNFKGIREVVRLPLSRFHVLVGANGSGKSTFLDAIDFVGDCLSFGLSEAVARRGVGDLRDLTWMRRGGVIKVDLFVDMAALLPGQVESVVVYSLAVRQDERVGVCVESEGLVRLSSNPLHYKDGQLVCDESEFEHGEVLLGKMDGRPHVYFRESGDRNDLFNFGAGRLALAETPPDLDLYPTANAVRRFLTEGVRYLQLNSRAMRLPCSALSSAVELALDGTNLARVVGGYIAGEARGDAGGVRWVDLETELGRWVRHLRIAVPDLENIGWGRREADNSEYLVVKYRNGLEARSGMLSDGTLRMMAMTLPAFLPGAPALYMVEEPENGVHPYVLELIVQSLSSMPSGQVFVATHSPFVVAQCGKDPLLCFRREEEGGTTIVPGAFHERLKGWDGSPDLSTVFAAGVLS